MKRQRIDRYCNLAWPSREPRSTVSKMIKNANCEKREGWQREERERERESEENSRRSNERMMKKNKTQKESKEREREIAEFREMVSLVLLSFNSKYTRSEISDELILCKCS